MTYYYNKLINSTEPINNLYINRFCKDTNNNLISNKNKVIGLCIPDNLKNYNNYSEGTYTLDGTCKFYNKSKINDLNISNEELKKLINNNDSKIFDDSNIKCKYNISKLNNNNLKSKNINELYNLINVDNINIPNDYNTTRIKNNNQLFNIDNIMNESAYLKNHLLTDNIDKYKQEDDKLYVFNNIPQGDVTISGLHTPSTQINNNIQQGWEAPSRSHTPSINNNNDIASTFYNNIMNNVLIQKNDILNDKNLLLSYKFDNDILNHINNTNLKILNGNINYIKSYILNNNCLLINNNTKLLISDIDISRHKTLSIIFWININNDCDILNFYNKLENNNSENNNILYKNYNMLIYIKNGYLKILYNNNDYDLCKISLNEWIFISLIFVNNIIKIYINSNYITTVNIINIYNDNDNDTNNIIYNIIGSNTTNNYLLYNLEIYDYVLLDNHINKIYLNNNILNYSNLNENINTIYNSNYDINNNNYKYIIIVSIIMIIIISFLWFKRKLINN
jgi:hypothetical protein